MGLTFFSKQWSIYESLTKLARPKLSWAQTCPSHFLLSDFMELLDGQYLIEVTVNTEMLAIKYQTSSRGS
jgi:hypothetical protein